MSKAKAYHLIEDYPNKLYYTIAEVADDIGMEQSALRFWENEFDILKPKRDPKGRRQYTKKDVLTVRQIYDLVKIEGLSLEGAKAKIKNKKGEVERNSELRAKLLSLKEQIKALSSLLTLPSEVETDDEEIEVPHIVGFPAAPVEEDKPVVFDTTPAKETVVEKTEETTVVEASPVATETADTAAEATETETADDTAENIVAAATEELATAVEETTDTAEAEAEEEPQQVHVFQQNSLFGEEFVEKITYTPKKDEPTEEPKENKKEDIDSRQLSLF